MFPCEFCKLCKNNFFAEHHQTTASDIIRSINSNEGRIGKRNFKLWYKNHTNLSHKWNLLRSTPVEDKHSYKSYKRLTAFSPLGGATCPHKKKNFLNIQKTYYVSSLLGNTKKHSILKVQIWMFNVSTYQLQKTRK